MTLDLIEPEAEITYLKHHNDNLVDLTETKLCMSCKFWAGIELKECLNLKLKARDYLGNEIYTEATFGCIQWKSSQCHM